MDVTRPITIRLESDKNRVVLENPDKNPMYNMIWGTMRSLVENMVIGVSQGYVKRLEVVGVGYQARLQGKELSLQLGFSEAVIVSLPDQVTVELPNPTHIVISGPDKQLVGEFAARCRKIRPPEPYKGKGIRYQEEVVRRKAGKAFVSAE